MTTFMTNLRARYAQRREHWAWYLYDFGNSAYAAVVLLAVYSAYFQNQVVGGANGTRLWGNSVGIAMLVVAILAPILGSLADFSGRKKRFLLYLTTITILFTAAMYFVQEGDILLGMVVFILAEIGYRGGQVFYNSLLPEIAAPEEISTVSGKGWAIGSLGGIVCLIIVLALILTIGGTEIVRLSFIITAIFFALSALPLFFIVDEKTKAQEMPPGENTFSITFKRLGETIRSVRQYGEFLKFMLAFLIYNDGILMALNFAAILGAVLFGMEQQQLIIFMIIVQAASVAGAYIFGIVGQRRGFRTALTQSLLLMIIAVIAIFFNTTITGFFMIGALAGFALTGVQSVSRALIGTFAPAGKSAEFYGFFAVAGRTSSFIGPTIFGNLVAILSARLIASGMNEALAEQSSHRWAVLSIAAFLVAGMALLMLVDEKEGRRQGQAATQPGAAVEAQA
ncbi:MAG: MFS transporter [Chloroflexi bacterium]|nr:MAG: MFS transporter [Chloroflexota bacterium]MBL1193021.1 MFS transporter [Chloroflexota bacterium]NOH10314.1 MFS transporter [Chloroflexota bacterium]